MIFLFNAPIEQIINQTIHFQQQTHNDQKMFTPINQMTSIHPIQHYVCMCVYVSDDDHDFYFQFLSFYSTNLCSFFHLLSFFSFHFFSSNFSPPLSLLLPCLSILYCKPFFFSLASCVSPLLRALLVSSFSCILFIDSILYMILCQCLSFFLFT